MIIIIFLFVSFVIGNKIMLRLFSFYFILILCSSLFAENPLYSPLDLTKVKTDIEAYSEDPSLSAEKTFSDFNVIHSDLFPGLLLQSNGKEMMFFKDLKEWGLEGPIAVAYAGSNGVEVKGGDFSVSGSDMKEAWLLFWFAGAKGWDKNGFDTPWLVILQKRPDNIKKTERGVLISYPAEAKATVTLPLYGYYKCPQKGSYLETRERGGPDVKSWNWLSDGLPADVVKRARWFTGISRFFPLDVKEDFQVVPATDSVVIRNRVVFEEIHDDWKTKGIRFAPLSHNFGLAHLSGWSVLKSDKKIHDPEMVTPYGPWTGYEGESEYLLTLEGVLKYVHEKEKYILPTEGPALEALKKIQDRFKGRFRESVDQYFPPFGLNNMVWSTGGTDFIFPKLIDFAPKDIRDEIIRKFSLWVDNYLLVDSFKHDGKTWEPWSEAKIGNKTYLAMEGPGIGGGVKGDAGKLAMNSLYTFWCYAHYMDRWEPVKKKWDMIGKALTMPINMNWKSVGREAIAEMGDEGQPAMAYTRLAYGLGDTDGYVYGAYVFARQSLHHYVKSVSGDWFKKYHPFLSKDKPPVVLYPTNMIGHTVGWHLGGPGFGSGQWANRYIRFNDEDMGRMHRDWFPKFQRYELNHIVDWIAEGAKTHGNQLSRYPDLKDDSHIIPSMLRLRSYLLDEDLNDLLKIGGPEDITGTQSFGDMLAQFSLLRMGVPRQYERLIAKEGKPSPFLMGIQRDATPLAPVTVMNIALTKYWPVPTWYGGNPYKKDSDGWKPPKKNLNYGTKHHFAFGAISPGVDVWPKNIQRSRVNWVTEVYSYEISTKAPVNLALEKHGTIASASDKAGDFTPFKRLNDGNLSQPFRFERFDDKKARWIQLDFDKTTRFDTIAVHGNNGIEKIEISKDGKSFTTVEPNPYDTTMDITFPQTLEAKSIRVTLNPMKGGLMYEFQVFLNKD